MILKFLAALLGIVHFAGADENRFHESQEYDNGQFGDFPIEKYKTTTIPAPRPNFFEYNGRCDSDGLYVMLSLRGYQVSNAGPMILDERGSLVWANDHYQQPYNVEVQTYRGEQYLTFWAGNDAIRGHGEGFYYMLDSTYNETYKVGAANGLKGDLHEFRITEAGTALITIYQIKQTDLSKIGGPADGWIWDCLFQEVDIETRTSLFEWRASDHFGIDASYFDADDDWSRDDGKTRDSAWDWYHINSVDKDPQGNYLISSRNTHELAYINGTSGDIIWTLGGRANMFEDLSGGEATNFALQHHARWRDDYTTISIFNNGLWPTHSSGLFIEVDQAKMTAKVKKLYLNPDQGFRLHSYSQGSCELLPNGNVLVGYGISAQYTEFSPAGEALCNVHFAAGYKFEEGNAQSYRIGKYRWVGKPNTSPTIVLSESHLYVSWMGATEVTHWRIEETDILNATKYDTSITLRKSGFETIANLSSVTNAYVRVVALDKHSTVLGTSDLLPTSLDTKAVLGTASNPPKRSPYVPTFITTLVIFATILSLGLLAFMTTILFAYLVKAWSEYRKDRYRKLVDPDTTQIPQQHFSEEYDNVGEEEEKFPSRFPHPNPFQDRGQSQNNAQTTAKSPGERRARNRSLTATAWREF